MKINNKRQQWAKTRAILEQDKYKHNRYGKAGKKHWNIFNKTIKLFSFFLKLTGLYERGCRNAGNIKIIESAFCFPELPDNFSGYRILHLSDLHLDLSHDSGDGIITKIQNLEFDLCVLTGDFQKKYEKSNRVAKQIKKITQHVKSTDGIFAVLGNHDYASIVTPLEKTGITVLTNETVFFSRKDETIAMTGIDDPHYYYTDKAAEALQEKNSVFKITIIHTPELYDIAAENNYNLYLCGHTHGGQVALPGGFPIITHVYTGKRFYRGPWKYRNMKGYTNQGCGVVGIPVRFNTVSEIAVITLLKKDERQVKHPCNKTYRAI